MPVDIESYEGAIRRGGLDSGHHGWLDDPEEEPLPGVDPNNFWIALPHQKDFARHAWADMAAGAARLSERVASFRNCLVPWTFVFLLGLLAALLAAGVIAPMFSLSARPGGSRDTLLAFFVPLSVLFVLYFGLELFRLRRAADLNREHY